MKDPNNQMLEAIAHGRQAELLKLAKNALRPYFDDKNALENDVTIYQLLSAYNIIKIYEQQNDCLFRKGLKYVLNIYRQSYSTKKEKTLSAIVTGYNEYMQKESFMHEAKKEFIKSSRSLPDDLYQSVFRLMAQIEKTISFSIQHIIIEMLTLFRILNGTEVDYATKTSLGSAIQELSSDPNLKEFLATTPEGIYIHDWRNIAAHSTYSVQNGQILCLYKDGKNQLLLSLDELCEYYRQIMRASNIINIAKTIFEFEHLNEISQQIKSYISTLEASTQMRIENIQTELLNENFWLDSELTQDGLNGIPTIWVCDFLNSPNETERTDQLAKYIMHVCRIFKENLAMIYCDKNGKAKQYIYIDPKSIDGVLNYRSGFKLSINVNPIIGTDA